ncbi:hypothetical protein [Actinophytocola glycyrrhizae]|uniref:Uncharacterized protein n=1 Tax=Actinophytocola glycyrrhizae TaxID=2044873 RepID=A0ABV9RTG9_9PSEU
MPGTDAHLRIINRANGDVGISPERAPDERELDRFVAHWASGGFPVGANGLPLPVPTGGVGLREVFAGGAEILVTEVRIVIVLVKGDSAFGKVYDERGTVVVVDLPYRSLTSVEVEREKGLFGRIKKKGVGLFTNRPLGRVAVNPMARLDANAGNPVLADDNEFADAIVRAAASYRLTATLMEKQERQRLERVRDGARVLDGLSVVAELENDGKPEGGAGQ